MNTCGLLVCLISAATLVAGTGETAYERDRLMKTIMLHRNHFGSKSMATYETCDPEEMSCQDDKLTFCAYGVAKVTIPCSSIFDGKPGYCDCDNVQCTATRSNCYTPETNKCTNEGKMPDPRDCKKFTYCNGKTKKSLSCPDGMTYDAEKQICSTEQPCRSVMCNPKKILEFIPFPLFPKYYLFCYFGVGEVRECSQPGYSMQSGKCQFQCKEPGLFADPKEENYKKGMWHICTRSNKVLVRTTKYCEKDGEKQLYFDEKKGICLPEPDGGTTTSTVTTTSTSPKL